MYFSDKISRVRISRLFSHTKFQRLRLEWRKRLGSSWLVAILGIFGPWACAAQNTASTRQYDISFKNQSEIEMQKTAARQGDLCELESVYDGDTVWVRCNGKWGKISLYCIDAPEMQQKPWGILSRDYLRSILSTQLVLERMDTDRYGRTVGRLFTLSGDDANLTMTQTGHAVLYPRYCPRSEETYYRAEKTAKDARSVVWSENGNQSAPWQWRSL